MKIFCFLVLLLVLCVSEVQARILFSDDFDHGSVFANGYEKWQLIDGTTDHWTIDEGVAQTVIYATYRMSVIVPRDEWWTQMRMPYLVTFLFKSQDYSDKNFVLGVRDKDNFYDVHFYGGKLTIEDVRNGVSIRQHFVPFSLGRHVFYLVRVEYDSAGFKIYINDELVISSPSAWAPLMDGKFGLKASTGAATPSRSQFDQIRVSSLVDHMPAFKQDDNLWAEEIYNHAAEWATQPTLSRWGCAVSAAAMLLRFHGFEWLGERLLDPSSLNAWLQTQADGYVGDGLLNWLAISRLSRELADQAEQSLPSLEFSHVSGNWSQLREFLLEKLEFGPQIGSTGGHFLLVDEFDVTDDDFRIRDPLFDYQWLSQSNPLRSLRLFRPSFTDLSYLLLVLPRHLSLSLSTEDWQEMEETLVASEGDEATGADYRLFLYQKPADQQLTMSFFGNNLSEVDLAKVKLFTYQTDGAMTVFSLADQLADGLDLQQVESLRWQLDYQKQAPSTISLEVIEKSTETLKLEYLDALLTQVNQAWQARQLSFYVYYQLQQLIGILREALDYLFLLDEFFAFYDLSFAKIR